jgi:hypothetical protein
MICFDVKFHMSCLYGSLVTVLKVKARYRLIFHTTEMLVIYILQKIP